MTMTKPGQDFLALYVLSRTEYEDLRAPLRGRDRNTSLVAQAIEKIVLGVARHRHVERIIALEFRIDQHRTIRHTLQPAP